MKIQFSIFAVFFSMMISYAQMLKKTPIDNSGCSLYSFCDLKFNTQKSEDSSVIYTSECEKDKMNYGVICVKLSESVNDLNVAEGLLISYLDYLKSSFNITQSVGYGKGHRLKNDENTRGVIDYWEDKDKNNWKVKGWTNGKFIGVLYGYSSIQLAESKLNIFLEGFRFPDTK